jgi:hypothetical protein
MTRNQAVHPIFAQMLETFGPTGPAIIENAQREAYVQALKNHNWSFEMSDDPRRYEEGRESLAQLRLAQREFDADYTIWNQHAPEAHRVGERELARFQKRQSIVTPFD